MNKGVTCAASIPIVAINYSQDEQYSYCGQIDHFYDCFSQSALQSAWCHLQSHLWLQSQRMLEWSLMSCMTFWEITECPWLGKQTKENILRARMR